MGPAEEILGSNRGGTVCLQEATGGYLIKGWPCTVVVRICVKGC